MLQHGQIPRGDTEHGDIKPGSPPPAPCCRSCPALRAPAEATALPSREGSTAAADSLLLAQRRDICVRTAQGQLQKHPLQEQSSPPPLLTYPDLQCHVQVGVVGVRDALAHRALHCKGNSSEHPDSSAPTAAAALPPSGLQDVSTRPLLRARSLAGRRAGNATTRWHSKCRQTAANTDSSAG